MVEPNKNTAKKNGGNGFAYWKVNRQARWATTNGSSSWKPRMLSIWPIFAMEFWPIRNPMGVEPRIGVLYPQNGWWKSWKTLLKFMIWGYPYFWKHPYEDLQKRLIEGLWTEINVTEMCFFRHHRWCLWWSQWLMRCTFSYFFIGWYSGDFLRSKTLKIVIFEKSLDDGYINSTNLKQAYICQPIAQLYVHFHVFYTSEN